jgi:UDP-glucuronate 4-epimerase
MRALVTGCAGFIGSHLTEGLLADGWTVIGIDCFNDNYGRRQKLRNLEHARGWAEFDFVPIDLARGDLIDVVEGADVIFHLAAEPGVRASWGSGFDIYLRNNVLATQHLLEAASTWPEKRFVYASSSSIYGDVDVIPTPESATPHPRSPYGMTKLSAEHLCNAYEVTHGVNLVRLRYFSVYGPRQRPDMAFHRFCRAVRERQPLRVFGDGCQTRDFTFVTDVVNATRAAANLAYRPGEVFNVGGGSRVTLNSAIELLGDLAGRKLVIEHGSAQQGEARHTGADISAARQRLVYQPTVDLRDGLGAELEWLDAEREERTPAVSGTRGTL